MKTGTSCTRCANASICPAYDSRMMYGFCQGFVDSGEHSKDVAVLDGEPLVEDLDVNAGAGMRPGRFLEIMGEIMSVKAEPAIEFTCEKCGAIQYDDYTLEPYWEDDRAVMADNIDCSKCGHTNRVFLEV